ncbi:AMP-binding protein [Marivirga sp.]|uniref:AMP-binding protein n=1 Tax=Marivirga sp. TaxID=2018662 RepID=UPI0025D476DB|nr:AMP-binding protein [Marivirga sp.]
MPTSSFTENWIQFNGLKYALNDFVKNHFNETSELIKIVQQFINDWKSDSQYILQQTSGSTGTPKTIEIAKSQIKASAQATLDTLGIRTGDHALLCINPEYIGGKMMIARAVIGGLNLSITPISSNPLKEYQTSDVINFFSFVPYQFEKILDESPDKIQMLDNSKAIILGGAPVSDSLAQKIKSTFNKTSLYSTYGMTETVSHVALKLINSDKNEGFKALKNIEFSTDKRNCLVIHAPEISGQEKLITNDVVNLVSSTAFHWLGRYDYVINSGGIKIHPEIIEKEIAELLEKSAINNRFFAFGLPDEKLGESLNLLVEGEVDKDSIYDLLKKNLKIFHAPKKVFSIDHFVETESGKINRKKTIDTIESNSN